MTSPFGLRANSLVFLVSLAFSCFGDDSLDELKSRSQAVLAQLDGEIRVPGLERPVRVLRDQWGIPHIYAENQADLFFAQGFVAAQDRLFQMDIWRRIAVGETAEVFGTGSLVRDRFARLCRYRGDINAEWTSYSADTREIATSFTKGINAYIDHLGDRLPIEFTILGYRPKHWQPEDCLGRMALLPVVANLTREVTRAELIATIGLEETNRLLPTDPPVDVQPALDLAGIDQSVLAGFNAATAPLITPVRPTADSNNWVVSGQRSASGKPMLANDPHRNIALPALRYLVHLVAPGWNVIGGGEPALPGVALGHNERIAWGFTIVTTDLADLFVEQTHPSNANFYFADGHWVPMTIVSETVRVKREDRLESVEIQLRYTRHGPVLHDDPKRQRAYVLKWVGSEPGSAPYLGSLAIDRAHDWTSFTQAAGRWKTPSENIVYADVDGNIGWIAAALTPIRKGWNGLLPVPGGASKYRWDGFLPVEQLPQAKNPESGSIATANQNILPAGYEREISYEWADPFRYRRVKELLESQQTFTRDDFQRMQHDAVSLPARELLALLGSIPIADATLKPFVKILTDWNAEMSVDSSAGALFMLWRQELIQTFFARRVPKHLFAQATRYGSMTVLVEALRNPGSWFKDPEANRNRLMVDSLSRAVQQARRKLGDDHRQWKLGSIQTVHFKHPLSVMGEPYARSFDLGPYPSGSDPFALNQARYDEKNLRIHGATYRHVFDLADWDLGVATSAPGQSGQPGSPHYSDLVDLWNKGEYFPLAYSREKVEEVTRHRLLLLPAK